MRAEICFGDEREEIVFPENTVFVNVMSKEFTICGTNDMADELGLDSVLYEKDVGEWHIKLYAWIDREEKLSEEIRYIYGDGKLAEEIRRIFGGMEMVYIEDGDFSLKITV